MLRGVGVVGAQEAREGAVPFLRGRAWDSTSALLLRCHQPYSAPAARSTDERLKAVVRPRRVRVELRPGGWWHISNHSQAMPRQILFIQLRSEHWIKQSRRSPLSTENGYITKMGLSGNACKRRLKAISKSLTPSSVCEHAC
jgi:hypothetical protein